MTEPTATPPLEVLPSPSDRAWASAHRLSALAEACGVAASVGVLAIAVILSLPALEPVPKPAVGAGFRSHIPSAPLGKALDVQELEGKGVVFVESEPAGARVTVNGAEFGETPVSADVDCSPGQKLVIAVARPGREPMSYEGTCKANTLLQVRARLAAAKR